MRRRIALLSLALVSFAAQGAEAPDKSGHHLFNPTPRDQMRELSTDRPDKTESPFTLDAGHFQVEADLFNWARDRSGDVVNQDFLYAAPNAKAGLASSLDFQVVVASYRTRRTEDRASSQVTEESGFGEVVTRLKWNALGNDGGPVALGLMPYATWPTGKKGVGGAGKVEGGVIVPLAVELPAEHDLGMMLVYGKALNEDGETYHGELTTSVAVSKTLTGGLGGYLELFSQSSNESGAAWIATFDTGLTYQVGENLQFDVGVNLGLTDAADDVNPFAGISFRY